MRLQLRLFKPTLASALTAVTFILCQVKAPRAEPGVATSRSIEVKARAEVAGYADTDHVTVLTPGVGGRLESPMAGWDVGVSYLADIVSAASVDIVSTASPRWTEVRHAGDVDIGYAPGDVGGRLSGSISVEPDYVSISGGASTKFELDDDHIVPQIGYIYSRDKAGRRGTPFDVYSLVLERHTAQAAVTIVVNRSTELMVGADAMFERGRQEKPYRYLPIFDSAVVDDLPNGAGVQLVDELRLPGRIEERLPGTRQRYVASGRLGWRQTRATLSWFQRFYADTWGLLASTSDARYVMDVGRRFELWPRVRLHAQRGVTFWQRAYSGAIEPGLVRAPDLRTGDRELGPLLSTTAGAGAAWRLGALARAPRVSILLEGTHTRFFDMLFIRDRFSGFTSILFGGSF